MDYSTPEEQEIEKKLRLLKRLRSRLVVREEGLAELRAELEQFEAVYTMEVGRYYADLDEVEAEIAEQEVKLNPEDEEIEQRAKAARSRAEASAEAVEEENWQACSHKWRPTAEARKAYYNLAKVIHPDLALDKEEQDRRHDLMARLNKAYSDGDQNLLNKLVEDYRDSPELVKGDTAGEQLVRIIRQISQVTRRLKEIRAEHLEIELSELYLLRDRVRAEQIEGRNLLSQMAARTKTHISKAKRRLSHLNNIVEAGGIEADKRFGLDVSAFK